jgi:hypothetical protein
MNTAGNAYYQLSRTASIILFMLDNVIKTMIKYLFASQIREGRKDTACFFKLFYSY